LLREEKVQKRGIGGIGASAKVGAELTDTKKGGSSSLPIVRLKKGELQQLAASLIHSNLETRLRWVSLGDLGPRVSNEASGGGRSRENRAEYYVCLLTRKAASVIERVGRTRRVVQRVRKEKEEP